MKASTFVQLAVKGLIVGAGAVLGASAVIAWTGPTGTAPNSNVSAPINIGSTAQEKTGTLEATRFYDDNNAYYVDSNSTSILNAISSASITNSGALTTSGTFTSNSYAHFLGGSQDTWFPYTNDYNYLRGHTFFNGVLYDENNSNYYVDPTGQSVLQDVNTWGLLRVNGGFVTAGGQLASMGGSVQMGGIPSGALDKYVCWSSANYYLSRANSCATSDVRLKEHIEPIKAGLAEILKLNPVEFEWKDKKMGEGTSLGLIAQEVKEVFPEAVTGSGTGVDGDWYGLDYDMLTAPMIKAIQELKAENDVLRAKNQALEERISKLEAFMNK